MSDYNQTFNHEHFHSKEKPFLPSAIAKSNQFLKLGGSSQGGPPQKDLKKSFDEIDNKLRNLQSEISTMGKKTNKVSQPQ